MKQSYYQQKAFKNTFIVFSATVLVIGPYIIESDTPIKAYAMQAKIGEKIKLINKKFDIPANIRPKPIIYLAFILSPIIPFTSCPKA